MEQQYPDKTVLIIDDDEMNLRVAEMLLKKELGVNTVLSAGGLDGIMCLQEREDIHLVLLDIQMPTLDGIRTLELIRKHEEWDGIPVIFLTASEDQETVEKAGRMGAAGYIRKPFLPQELVDQVKRALRLS